MVKELDELFVIRAEHVLIIAATEMPVIIETD